jgi:YVTN family beta-propeller protein
VAFLPDDSRAYVPSENGGTLTMIDVKKLAPIKTITLGQGVRPMGTRISPDGKWLFVSTGRTGKVFVLDTATNTVAASFDVGNRPWGLGLSPDAMTLYTANGPSDDVSVVDVASRMVRTKIKVGHGPWGLAVVPAP